MFALDAALSVIAKSYAMRNLIATGQLIVGQANYHDDTGRVTFSSFLTSKDGSCGADAKLLQKITQGEQVEIPGRRLQQYLERHQDHLTTDPCRTHAAHDNALGACFDIVNFGSDDGRYIREQIALEHLQVVPAVYHMDQIPEQGIVPGMAQFYDPLPAPPEFEVGAPRGIKLPVLDHLPASGTIG